jgi:hypothetical protein
MAQCLLRILVFPETHRTWIARGLEHDLSASGRSIESAVDTVVKIALAHIAYDERHKRKPLSAFASAPRLYWDAFTRATPFPFPVDIPASDSGAPARIVAAVADRNPAIRASREAAQTA